MNVKRTASFTLAVVLLVSLIVGAYAYTQSATLNYTGISINLDGQPLIPRDVTGKPVNPFVISGTTYLPIRAVASALGLGVDWIQDSQTVVLSSDATDGTIQGEDTTKASTYTSQATLNYPGIKILLDGTQLEPKDVNGNIVDPFVIDGTTYLPIRAIASALGINVDWDQESQTVILMTDEYAEAHGGGQPTTTASGDSSTNNGSTPASGSTTNNGSTVNTSSSTGLNGTTTSSAYTTASTTTSYSYHNDPEYIRLYGEYKILYDEYIAWYTPIYEDINRRLTEYYDWAYEFDQRTKGRDRTEAEIEELRYMQSIMSQIVEDNYRFDQKNKEYQARLDVYKEQLNVYWGTN